MKYAATNRALRSLLGLLLAVAAGQVNAATSLPDETRNLVEDGPAYTDTLSNYFIPFIPPLTYSVQSISDPQNLITGISLDAGTGALTVTFAPERSGTAAIRFRGDDMGGPAFWILTFDIASVNDAPAFLLGSDPAVLEDDGPQVLAGWASGMTPGPANEAGQTLTFNVVSNSNPGLFAVAPSLDPVSGDLTFTTAADASGNASIVVNLSDDGGTANGGVDVSPDLTFAINVAEVNDAPGFAAGGDQTVLEDSGAQAVATWATGMTVGPANESFLQTGTFNILANTNAALFAVAPSVDPISGDLTYTPAPDASGVATITLNYSDDGGTANGGVDTSPDQSFDITVTHVNDAPSFTGGADQNVLEDAGPQTVAGWATGMTAGPANESGQTLTFNVVGNTNATLFAVAPAVDPVTGDLTYAPGADVSGTATITLNLSDDGGTANGGVDTSADVTFDITVGNVNDAPTFTAGANQTLLEDAAPQTVAGWATGMTAGPANESGQTLTFNVVGNSNPTLFSAAPAIDAVTGDLTYAVAPDRSGSATITLNLSDDGGTADGGVDTSPDQTFVIDVTDVNDVPVFAAGADQTVLEDSGAHSVPGWATALSVGPADEASQALTFNVVSNTNSSLFVVQPAIDGTSGDLTYTLAADRSGSATITVNVTDGGGTANGGIETSGDQTFTIDVTDVNDAPSFASGGAVVVPEDTGAHVFPAWASGMIPGPAEETSQVLTFTVIGNDNTALFATQPVVDEATGDLSFALAPDTYGVANITLNLSDDGGTANGGVDTSPNVVFPITVGEVNDAPSFVGGGDEAVLEDVGSVTVANWATALSAGPANESAQVLTFVVTANTFPGLFAAGPVVDGVSGDLTYAPATNVSGTATITVELQDDGGTAGGGVDTSPAYTFDVVVTPVNDAPTFTSGGNVAVAEDAGFVDQPWASSISPGAPDEAGQVLTFNVVSNSNAGMFLTQPVIDSVTGNISFETQPDANGSATLVVNLSDDGGVANGGADTSADVTFEIVVSGVNDIPLPANDAATMDEDSGTITIPVMANDYLAEQPTTLILAGVGGESEGAHQVFIDQNGDPVDVANGTVTVVGNDIEYTPREHFFGDDTFTYTIQDADGDVGTATVTVTVNEVNDPPTGPALRTFTMLENSVLVVEEADGLEFGSYDLEGAVIDTGTGNQVGSNLTIQVLSFPSVGVVSLDNLTGSFTYTPPVDYTGQVSLLYQLDDGTDNSGTYEARIVIFDAPEAPPPPPPGEVAVFWNLSNVPLEQSTSVPPNVIIMMDDSGSMDWNLIVRGVDDQGGFVIDNDSIATQNEYSFSFYYLWDLPDNIFGINETNGRILATEQALEADSHTDDNEYGVWRARNHLYNTLYYNPAVMYEPWTGVDAQNVPFADADPYAIRLDPRDPTNVFDMMEPHEYEADDTPRWRTQGGHEEIFMDASDGTAVHIPRYYTTTGTVPLQWDDPHTLVEIDDPLATYAGGPNREDCAVGDDDPLTCTYDQEIQNFANFFQYYRKREYAAKAGLGRVVSAVQDIRLGYETINDVGSEPMRDMNDLHTEGNKKLLMDQIYLTDSANSTPLRQALERAGEMFAGNEGDDPLLPDPEGLCQQNFTLLFSDGYWNGSDPSVDNDDGDNDSDFDGGRYADTEDETLADVAMYYYENDLRGTMEDLVPVSQRDRVAAPDGTFDSGGSARMHQHMKTYTVAFGVVGTVDPSAIPSDPTQAFTWPDPETSPQAKIDDMLHAAVNGRGQFLSATDPQALQTALETAFQEFTQAASSTSAAAFNSTSLEVGTLLYRGFYDLRDNTGELSATTVTTTGELTTTVWLASELLDGVDPNTRTLMTYDGVNRVGIPFTDSTLTPEQQLMLNDDEVNYLRGDTGNEQPSGALRNRTAVGGLLGDIVNSSPVFVGEPRGLDRDQEPFPESDLYSDFADAYNGRQELVYVGSNDGILHGFDAVTGAEQFGYVPNKIIDGTQSYHSLLQDFTSPFYQHRYFVDLSPRVSDAYVRPNPGVGSQSWNTVLLGGLGAGGKGFFALNVTNPAAYSEANADDIVMWEFTDADDTSPNGNLDPSGAPVKDLGYALSLPTLAMSNVETGGEQEWVAIFGNGPNSTAGIAKLFVLFTDRGLDGWGPSDFVKLDTGYGVPIAPEQLAGYPNGLGTPALVDTDLNGTVDWVYAGDRLGNLYRFDLCNRDISTQLCDTDPGGWSVTRLFTATYDEGTVDRLQPILSQPLVFKHPTEDGFLVVFGTGSYQTRDDADSQEIQSIYAIWDRGSTTPPTALSDTKALRLVKQTMSNVVDDSVDPAQVRRVLTSLDVNYTPESASPGTYGWYVDLDMERPTTTLSGAANGDTSGQAPPGAQFPGEKAIRRFVLRNGVIATTTVLPSLDEFSCYGTRPGALLLFDALTGGDASGGDPDRAVVDFNNDGVIDADDMVEVGGELKAGGLLFDPGQFDGALVDLSVLGGTNETGGDFLFPCGGNDCLPFLFEPPNSSNTGRLSWRELDIR